jgi:peptidoglycan/LPS O-acetylase OafA/YrhL
MAKHGKRLDYLDALRVLALGAVISFHYLFNGISKGTVTSIGFTPLAPFAKYGYLGVELFFLISGFVILYSTQNRSATEFIKKRFMRLYPMYWIAIITIFAITHLPVWDHKGPSIKKTLLSLTMFPTAFGGDWIDNAHWFLMRELQFYLFVVVVMALGFGKHLPKIFPWWAITICIWGFAGLPTGNIWYFSGYFSLITGGAIIFCIREWGFTPMRVIGLIAAYIYAVDSRMTKSVSLGDIRNTTYNKYIVATIVTAAFLLVMATLSSKVSGIHFAWAGIAGAITYPLFLIHGRMGQLILQSVGTDSNKYVVYPLVLAGAIGLAYGLLKLEKKVLKSR